MYNLNSPIINNMQQQGMNTGMQPAYGCIPSSPIGNIVSIGNIGYNTNTGNSAYYGMGINNRYNPYYRQQQEMMIAQQRETMRCQSDIMKKISRSAHKALGEEVDDEFLNKRYDPQFEMQYQQRDPDEDIYNSLVNMQTTGREIPYNVYCYNMNVGANNYCEQMKQRFPDDISMAEYHDRAGELLIEAALEKQHQQEKNLTKLYNTNGYTEMIQRYKKQASYFNTLLGDKSRNINTNGETIDDINVSLPNHLSTELMRRKSAFLNSIMNNG